MTEVDLVEILGRGKAAAGLDGISEERKVGGGVEHHIVRIDETGGDIGQQRGRGDAAVGLDGRLVDAGGLGNGVASRGILRGLRIVERVGLRVDRQPAEDDEGVVGVVGVVSIREWDGKNRGDAAGAAEAAPLDGYGVGGGKVVDDSKIFVLRGVDGDPADDVVQAAVTALAAVPEIDGAGGNLRGAADAELLDAVTVVGGCVARIPRRKDDLVAGQALHAGGGDIRGCDERHTRSHRRAADAVAVLTSRSCRQGAGQRPIHGRPLRDRSWKAASHRGQQDRQPQGQLPCGSLLPAGGCGRWNRAGRHGKEGRQTTHGKSPPKKLTALLGESGGEWIRIAASGAAPRKQAAIPSPRGRRGRF